MTGSTRLRLDRTGFRIRSVMAEDRPAIEAIAAQIWDGHDYLPRVFDAWLAEQSGIFCAAELDGRVVAVGKLSHLGGDQWWMEGLRVDPAFRGMGIARIMHHFLAQYCRRYAPGTLRFSTASENGAILHIAGEVAFQPVARFAAYGAPAAREMQSERLALLTEGDVDRAWACLNGLPAFAAARRTLEDNWRYLPLTPDLLRLRLAAGQVYGWRHRAGSGRLAGLAIVNGMRTARTDDDSTTEQRLMIGFAAASQEDALAFALALRGLGAHLGADRISWKIVDDPAALAGLQAAGYEDRWGMRVMLFERELSLTDRAFVGPGELFWPEAGG